MIQFTRQRIAITKNKKLKKYEVLEIVELRKSGVNARFIAGFYNCTHSLVSQIASGYRWKRLTKISSQFKPILKAHVKRKLSVQKVRTLRKNWNKGRTQGELAKRYKLNQSTVFDIVHGRTYRGV